ncbi:hypothetical protein [Burkholderia phage BCSR5]|nr:hypothetical protein [Burkholderia phage BCSR5]
MSHYDPSLFRLTEAEVKRHRQRSEQRRKELYEVRGKIEALHVELARTAVNEQGQSGIPQRFLDNLEDLRNWLLAQGG